jgi:antitoxin MazE
MVTQIAKWGNSLGIRIPRDVAARLGLTEGTRVEIEPHGDRIMITKAARRFTLEELLEGMTPERQHPAIADDAPRGSEAL